MFCSLTVKLNHHNTATNQNLWAPSDVAKGVIVIVSFYEVVMGG